MTSRQLELIGEHTIDTSLLTPGGFVLDAGCRNFHFSHEMAGRGCRVLAFDADPTVEMPATIEIGIEKVVTKLNDGISFNNLAIADKAGELVFVMSKDPQGRHLGDIYPAERAPKTRVAAVTIEDVMKASGVAVFDAVKLDIEGAEYEILLRWPGGHVAKQISVEFHEHCAPRPPSLYAAIFAHLGQWYEVVQHTKEARHCAAPNWYDTLLIRKGE